MQLQLFHSPPHHGFSAFTSLLNTHFSTIIIVSVKVFVQENETKQKEAYYRELGVYKDLGVCRKFGVHLRELGIYKSIVRKLPLGYLIHDRNTTTMIKKQPV